MNNNADLPPDPPAADARGAVTRAEFLNLFAAVFLPMFMAAVDQTLLATATPAVAASLGGLRDTSWIMSAYLLASATIAPVYGRLGDARGKRNMLLVALSVFTLGSLACGLAQSLPQLVAARVVQGLGGGGLMVMSQALIGELVPPVDRVRFQGYFAFMFTTASIGGPVVGGVVVAHVSWRWLFFANLPFALFAAWRLMKLPRGDRHPRAPGTDVAGHVLFAIGTVSLLFWLTSGGHRFEWASAASYALAATAAAALAALFWNERRHPVPFLPMDLLGQRIIARSALLVMLWAACVFALIFFLPVYFQLGHRIGAAASGLLLLPVTAGQVTAAMIVARVLRRTGEPRGIPAIGMLLCAAALALLGLLPAHLWIDIPLGFMAGLGLGCVMPVNQVVVQTAAGRSKLGVVMAMISLARSTGGAAGAALFGALIFALLPEGAGLSLIRHATPFEIDRALRAFHTGFLCAAAVAAIAAVIAWRIPNIRLWERAKH
jgi:EmrB/QacA subfamily drug resistance transporter